MKLLTREETQLALKSIEHYLECQVGPEADDQPALARLRAALAASIAEEVDPEREWYRKEAREKYQEECSLEVQDDAAIVKLCPEEYGAYVLTWLWVDGPEADPAPWERR